MIDKTEQTNGYAASITSISSDGGVENVHTSCKYPLSVEVTSAAQVVDAAYRTHNSHKQYCI